jgi:hypothetical protein
MPNESRIVTDPFNNRIYLISGICDSINGNSSEIYEEVSRVIEKPAICVEVKQNKTNELYYYRSIDWHHTILITVHYHNERWETSNCEKNPSNEKLSGILKKGRQLI